MALTTQAARAIVRNAVKELLERALDDGDDLLEPDGMDLTVSDRGKIRLEVRKFQRRCEEDVEAFFEDEEE